MTMTMTTVVVLVIIECNVCSLCIIMYPCMHTDFDYSLLCLTYLRICLLLIYLSIYLSIYSIYNLFVYLFVR